MKKLISTLSIIILIASCKKQSEECHINMESIAGTYKMTAVTYQASASSPVVDYFQDFIDEACERDDIIILHANGTYDYKDAGLVCVPSGDDNGTWSIEGNNLITDGWPINIQSFDCHKLIFSDTYNIVPGDKITITWTRQ